MPEPSVNTPRAEDYLPDWTVRRFIVLEPSGQWAPAVALQTAEILRNDSEFRGRPPEFENCETARDVTLFCEHDSTVGLILFLEDVERDCLSLLGRLARLPLRPPILAVCKSQHRELFPTLSEAGVDTALFDVVNDIPIAEWCVRILQR